MGKGGSVHGYQHFTGKKKGVKKTRRKGLTRKERKANRGTKKQKYPKGKQ